MPARRVELAHVSLQSALLLLCLPQSSLEQGKYARLNLNGDVVTLNLLSGRFSDVEFRKFHSLMKLLSGS